MERGLIMWNVLYVEDEENDAYFMQLAFRRAGKGESLRVVVDGQAAIDYLSGCGPFGNRLKYPLPTAVLLDLNLPTVSGFQVLTWIRQQPAFQQLPVVIFSSSARVEDRLKAKELGASDYLEKPGSGLEFATVLEMLNRQSLVQPVAPGLLAQNSGSLATAQLPART
jgi:two-component system response regulator